MNDTKEIVLFFDKNTSYDTLEVAKELVDRYPELGNPIIMPEVQNQTTPLILFNANPEFRLQCNYVSINFIMEHSYFERLASIIFDVIDAFAEFKCNFVRIGYIANNFLAPQYVERAKEKYLKIADDEDIKDFNFSWYKGLETKIGKINCWQKIITDTLDFDDLLVQFDFNTPIAEKIDFDIKYIKEFLKVTNSYIEEGIDF